MNQSKQKTDKKKIIKSYALVHKANPRKLESLFQLYTAYRQQYSFHMHDHWKRFLRQDIQDSQFSWHIPHKKQTTPLSAGYVQSCLNQVYASLNSYLSSLEQKYSQYLAKSSLHDREILHQLRTLNKAHAWFHREASYYSTVQKEKIDPSGAQVIVKQKQETPIAPAVMKLNRKIIHHILDKQRVKFPRLDRPKLVMDNRLYRLENNKKAKFAYWLHISTLEKGQHIAIPILSHEYFKNSSGTLGTTIELKFNFHDYEKIQHCHDSLSKPKKSNNRSLRAKGLSKAQRSLEFIFNKQQRLHDFSQNTIEQKSRQFAKNKLVNNNQPVIHKPRVKDKVVAFDIGLSSLLATSNGQLLGRGWLQKLSVYDKKITKLAANRQSMGLKTRSQRYDRLLTSVRGFMKTEIHRILNHYFHTHQNIGTVVMESLSFSNPSLSRRLNRLVQNFGLRFLKDKLAELSLVYGFKVVELNPAYSSQQCHACGYVDKNNRTRQSLFKCLCCGKTMNADIQASRVLLKRFHSDSLAYKSPYKSVVLKELKESFVKEANALVLGGKVGRRRLSELIASNNYYMEKSPLALPKPQGWGLLKNNHFISC